MSEFAIIGGAILVGWACLVALDKFEQRRASRPLRDVAQDARRARRAHLIALGFQAGSSAKWSSKTEKNIKDARAREATILPGRPSTAPATRRVGSVALPASTRSPGNS